MADNFVHLHLHTEYSINDIIRLMNILTLGNNFCTRILSEKLAENSNNKIYSTINANEVSFVDIPTSKHNELIDFIKNNNIELVIPADFRVIESEFSTLCLKENISVLLDKCILLNTYLSHYFAEAEYIEAYDIRFRVDYYKEKEDMYLSSEETISPSIL